MAQTQAAILGGKPTDYAGDVAVDEAWRILNSDPQAVLVDVRTKAEWTFVGVADLAATGRPLHLVEWQTYPSMDVNASFADDIVAAGVPKEAPVFLLCRSGQRSRAAAQALTAAGYAAAFNVAGGFEGDLNTDRHRGQSNGWKAAGLPWQQN